MSSRLSGHFSIFGLVFFVLKSLPGIAGQWSRKKTCSFGVSESRSFGVSESRSHVRILIYGTWAFVHS